MTSGERRLVAVAGALLALSLTHCGGGGGSDSTPGTTSPLPPAVVTTISGTVSPPPTPLEVTSLPFTAFQLPATKYPNVLIPPGTELQSYTAIVQSAGYSVQESGKILIITAVEERLTAPASPLGISTGGCFSGNCTFGAWSQLITSPSSPAYFSAGLNAPVLGSIGALPTAEYDSNNIRNALIDVVLPGNTTWNPSGYTYQTFGVWRMVGLSRGPTDSDPNDVAESYFSMGIPSTFSSLPTSGSATYSGKFAGTFVHATTGILYDVSGAVTANVNFGARTISLASSNMSVLADDAASGTPRTANPGLTVSGTLAYVAGSNTATGTISATNGMSGSATVRFYGPGIPATTASKATGSPAEFGGTLAVQVAGVGSMQGAFGAD